MAYEILQVEDVIFTWSLRGVLNDTIMRILAEIVELRLTVDKGFYSVTQEILQAEDVIFTWREVS